MIWPMPKGRVQYGILWKVILLRDDVDGDDKDDDVISDVDVK